MPARETATRVPAVDRRIRLARRAGWRTGPEWPDPFGGLSVAPLAPVETRTRTSRPFAPRFVRVHRSTPHHHAELRRALPALATSSSSVRDGRDSVGADAREAVGSYTSLQSHAPCTAGGSQRPRKRFTVRLGPVSDAASGTNPPLDVSLLSVCSCSPPFLVPVSPSRLPIILWLRFSPRSTAWPESSLFSSIPVDAGPAPQVEVSHVSCGSYPDTLTAPQRQCGAIWHFVDG